MKHLTLFCLTICIAAAAACRAQTVRSGLAEVAVIDRDTGAALGTHYFHGEYWVAGRPGARYAVEIRNRTGERLLAVTSVDGINVVSGATAAWDQTGYVFAPWESYEITGWRKTNSEVAAFTFASSPDSYAERTGRPGNIGVIGVALFRERRPEPAHIAPALPGPEDRLGESAAPAPGSAGAPGSADLAENMASAQNRASAAASAGALPSDSPRAFMAPAPQPAPKLGTGHGEREYSYVSNTEFLRTRERPDALIRIRYDSLENLVAMGIVPRARPWPSVDPFPGSTDRRYVPDPPG